MEDFLQEVLAMNGERFHTLGFLSPVPVGEGSGDSEGYIIIARELQVVGRDCVSEK